MEEKGLHFFLAFLSLYPFPTSACNTGYVDFGSVKNMYS